MIAPPTVKAFDELAVQLRAAASAHGDAPLDDDQEHQLEQQIRDILLLVIDIDPAAEQHVMRLGLEKAVEDWAAARGVTFDNPVETIAARIEHKLDAELERQI